jgi:DNA-binding Lrp family transcriptional regulator
VLFQHAAAGRLDLTPTELETFRLVQHEGTVTASEMAKQTGLTPASMSAIIDKLAGRGFLTREQALSRHDLCRPEPLGFRVPTVCDVGETLWSHARNAKRSRTRFFEHMRTITAYLVSRLAHALDNVDPIQTTPEIEKQIWA